jgi:hypothetical protein
MAMNPKVAQIVGATIIAAFSFPLIVSRGPADNGGLGMMFLITYIGIIATILAWEPRKRP